MSRGTTKAEAVVVVGVRIDGGVAAGDGCAAFLEAGLRISVRRWQKEERISGAGFADIVGGVEGRQREGDRRERAPRRVNLGLGSISRT